MDKNEFDIDFDFEEEYGFDPKDFLSEDEDFDFSEITEGDGAADSQDETKRYHFDQPPAEFEDVDLTGEEDSDYTSDFPG